MKTYYAINLNGKYAGLSRWALYQMVNGEMSVVWPTRKGDDDTKRDLMSNQVFYPRKGSGQDKYPAFHFVVKGYGTSHLGDLSYNLAQEHKEDVEVWELHGHNPSPHSATFNRPVSVIGKAKRGHK